ncbi:DUF4123 domain-containing protein [Pelomonas sp. KK5]|uniref:DUF4123 domain-containing protein n=1 Tax=Pelomonas sp. KK5 TaxID=1855730 RepID=UPI00097CB80A|nr:DUF4123 domain-containing protein [Pelomonas sp. KK5]
MDKNNAPALSPAQLKSALWADRLVQVYALILGHRIGELPERLAAADGDAQITSYDCVLPGALSPQRRRTAPYLVALKPESTFTDWLLNKAAGEFADWGVLVRTRLSFLGLRSHSRDCLEGRLPDGQPIVLEWMDPAVLRLLLPLAPGDQVEELLGPLETLVMTGTERWTLCSQQFGRLQMQDQPLMAGA